jgi:hypothetical protein
VSKLGRKYEIELRGLVLTVVVNTESILILIILHCSIPFNTAQKESEEFKIRRLTFYEIITKARKLLKKYHPDLHKLNVKLFSDLEKVAPFRNWFAHCPIIWKDLSKKKFQIQNTKVDSNGFEYNHYIEYSRDETDKFLLFILHEIIPPLDKLSSEIQSRLKDSHPQLYSLIQQAYNEQRAK